MSHLTAQQIYERTRGKDSPENVGKRNLEAFGHKGAKSKALKKKMVKVSTGANLNDIGYTVEDHKGNVLKKHEGKGRFSLK